MSKEKRLGRGLEALLGRAPEAAPAAETPADHPAEAETAAGELVRQLNVYEIDTNPFQPRTEFDEAEISALCESIKEHGVLQPIVVRRQGDRFQLISGERRWRAATRAGWSEVPALIREADDRETAELTIVENLQRKDLGPLEKAVSFQRYLEQFGCTQEELAKRLSIDRSTVSNLIRLLELPEAVKRAVSEQKITSGHARALLPLGEEWEQVAFCQRIQEESLSVRAVEELVKETIEEQDEPAFGIVGMESGRKKKKKSAAGHQSALEQEFRQALGTRVDIRQSARGRGKITIHFTSHEEFDRLRTHLAGPFEQRAVG